MGKTRLAICLTIAAAFCVSVRAQEDPKFDFPSGHPPITQAIEALDQERYDKSARLFVAAINESWINAANEWACLRLTRLAS